MDLVQKLRHAVRENMGKEQLAQAEVKRTREATALDIISSNAEKVSAALTKLSNSLETRIKCNIDQVRTHNLTSIPPIIEEIAIPARAIGVLSETHIKHTKGYKDIFQRVSQLGDGARLELLVMKQGVFKFTENDKNDKFQKLLQEMNEEPSHPHVRVVVDFSM